MIYISGMEDDAAVVLGVIRTNLTGTTIDLPTVDPHDVTKDVKAGDLAVLYDVPTNTVGQPAFVVPSGFATLISQSSPLTRAIASYKILTAADLGDTLTGAAGTSFARKNLLVFRMNRPVQSVTRWNDFLDADITDGNPTTRSVLASGTPALNLLVIGFASSSAAITDADFAVTGGTGTPYLDIPGDTADPQGDGGAGSGSRSAYAYYRDGLVSSNMTLDIPDLGGVNTLAGIYITLT